jgi:hypothetical protein
VGRFWGVAAGLTALIVVPGGFISPAAARLASPPAGPGPAAASASAGRLSVSEVTLITGDRIRVITGPGGRQSAMVDARYARPGVALILHPDGAGRWTTTVTPPRGAAFVSLSASLTDAAGNSTQQTVIRAYQI